MCLELAACSWRLETVERWTHRERVVELLWSRCGAVVELQRKRCREKAES
jgi:hypothetical protein